LIIQFSDGSGFSVSEQPIRVASDGTVVAATPLYINSSSGQIGAGTVSLVLTQGNVSSSPVSLIIQDLPSVSSYGTQNGQITHAFLTYAEMRAARRLGEFQAFAELPGNTIDTSQAQATLQTHLADLIQARNDSDRVSLDNSLIINGGSLSNGNSIQFDQNSLDMMDRVFGLYLTELPTIYSSPGTGAALKSKHFHHLQRRPKGSLLRSKPLPRFLVSPEQASSGGLSAVLSFLTTVDSLNTVDQEFLPSFYKDATLFDKVQAIVTGGTAVYAMALGTGTLGQQVTGLALGTLLPAVHLLDDFTMESYDLGRIIVASATGNDPAVLQAAQQDIANRSNDAWNSLIQTEVNLATVGAFGGFGTEVYQSFLAAQSTGGLALQTALFVNDVGFCAQTSCYTVYENAALGVAAEVASVFPSDTQGFGVVSGTVNISNDQGGNLVGDTGIAVGSFDVQSSDMTALADPNGNYDFFIALQAPNTNYANLTVTAFDPVTSNILSSTPIDLSGLNTSTPQQLPTLQGTCSDPGAPDGDDPDCD
jgi:hypothetical protein